MTGGLWKLKALSDTVLPTEPHLLSLSKPFHQLWPSTQTYEPMGAILTQITPGSYWQLESFVFQTIPIYCIQSSVYQQPVHPYAIPSSGVQRRQTPSFGSELKVQWGDMISSPFPSTGLWDPTPIQLFVPRPSWLNHAAYILSSTQKPIQTEPTASLLSPKSNAVLCCTSMD